MLNCLVEVLTNDTSVARVKDDVFARWLPSDTVEDEQLDLAPAVVARPEAAH